MSDPAAELRQAITKLQRDAYRQGWSDALSAIKKAAESIADVPEASILTDNDACYIMKMHTVD